MYQMEYEPIPALDEELVSRIIGAAIEVHRLLGPGFLESIYERALVHELSLLGIQVERQKEILVPYKDIHIRGQRLDLLAGGRVIVELKTVEQFGPIHQAKLISYLRATKLRIGLLINFHVPLLRDGI
ncbi:MAG: GxxExxY protein [Pirellulales bacterium]